MKNHNRSTNEDEDDCFYDAIDNDLFFKTTTSIESHMNSISNKCQSSCSSGDESENVQPFFDTSTCGSFNAMGSEKIDSDDGHLDRSENSYVNNDEDEECEDFELETAWSFWLDK